MRPSTEATTVSTCHDKELQIPYYVYCPVFLYPETIVIPRENMQHKYDPLPHLSAARCSEPPTSPLVQGGAVEIRSQVSVVIISSSSSVLFFIVLFCFPHDSRRRFPSTTRSDFLYIFLLCV